jgi:hypothetical protein
LLCGGQGVGQAAQHSAVGDELKQAAVEADGEALSGELDADRVLPTGHPD